MLKDYPVFCPAVQGERFKFNILVILREEEALEKSVELLKKGELVVVPTDTIYGILADATNESAVRNLYELRRPSGRPFIVLIPSEEWIEKLCLKLEESYRKLLNVEGLTLVLPKSCSRYDYINRESLAVRKPLRGFVRKVLSLLDRPVVAPSANPEGLPPARTAEEAYRYFREKVSLYVDGGRLEGEPSTVLSLVKGPRILREGRVKREELERLLRSRL